MDQYSTFRVGGRAEAICFPSELALLRQVVSFLSNSDIPYLVIGKGSNLLVRDGGIEGIVIILRGELAAIVKDGEGGDTLRAGGGATIGDLLSYCADNNLSGPEFLAGIPGTMGGAVFMNAGAFGKELGEMVEEIYVVTRGGELVVMGRSQLAFSYRQLSLAGGTVIHGVKLRLHKDTGVGVRGRILDYLRRRKESQPLDLPSAGSVFRNPPGDYAGRLIEGAGLKGKRIGGAMISRKHANFIVNSGGARAGDVLSLMDLARNRVRDMTGIELEPEIRIVGRK